MLQLEMFETATPHEMLRASVEDSLAERMANGVVTYDDDGDIPLTAPDGTTMFVRVHPEGAVVSVFAFISAPSVEPAQLLQQLNTLNARIPLAKAILTPKSDVLVEVKFIADPYSPDVLFTALDCTHHATITATSIIAAAPLAANPSANHDHIPGYL